MLVGMTEWERWMNIKDLENDGQKIWQEQFQDLRIWEMVIVAWGEKESIKLICMVIIAYLIFFLLRSNFCEERYHASLAEYS